MRDRRVSAAISEDISEKTETKKRTWKRLLPQLFIIGYIVMAALFTYIPTLLPEARELFVDMAPLLGVAAHRFMTLALFLIGAGLSREALRQTGMRPLLVAFLLWLVASVATAAALKLGWIAANLG